jgi:cysteine desulfurase
MQTSRPSLSSKVHYFDHNATTPVSEDVVRALPALVQAWGNPSSIHWAGRQPKNILRDTRNALAKGLGCHPLEIIFTSGGSESNNTVLQGVWQSPSRTRAHFMCSEVEHPSVMNTMAYLKSLGAKVDFIPVNRAGELDMDFYERHLTVDTALVSVMLANNETGTLFPIRALAEKAHAVGALFHCDAVQAFGKIPVNVSDLDVDFASFSGHKFYSLKGTGFYYVRKGNSVVSLIHGGGQERHRRGGTENVVGIGALGVMAARMESISAHARTLAELRDHFEQRVLSEITDVTVTASESPRLPNTSSLVIAGVDGETLLMNLDIKGYAVSTGAACSSGNPEPSPVLLAMGLSRGEAQSSLRVSLGWENTLIEVDEFIDTLKTVVERLRKIESEAGVNVHAE